MSNPSIIPQRMFERDSLGATPLETTRRYYRIDRRQIAYLKFILEGYDGMAVLTTIDAARGDVVIHIAPGCEEDFDGLIQDLAADVYIRPASGPA
jgi:hypothetical protein